MITASTIRIDSKTGSKPTSKPSASTVQCGKGWVGVKGRCRRAEAVRRLRAIKNRSRLEQGKHLAEHLGENVASWGVGKVVGGAIAQVGVKLTALLGVNPRKHVWSGINQLNKVLTGKSRHDFYSVSNWEFEVKPLIESARQVESKASRKAL